MLYMVELTTTEQALLLAGSFLILYSFGRRYSIITNEV